MSIYDKSSLVLIPSGTKTGKVFSQKPTNGDGDFTFTRASAATRVNAAGNIEKETQNLLKYSNDFNNAGAWSKITNTTYTIATETITDPFGFSNSVYKITLTGSGFVVIRQSFTGETRYMTASAYIKKSSSGLNISVDQSDDGTAQSASNTDWQRLSAPHASGYSFSFIDINITGVSGDYFYVSSAQMELGGVSRDYIETTTSAVYKGITNNVPRLDYTDGSCPALLLEPQRTNLITQSEYANSGGWGNSVRVTSLNNQSSSPEGLVNATKINETAVNNTHIIDRSFVAVSGTAYTLSYFAKAAERTQCYIFAYSDNSVFASQRAIFNLSNGTITSNTGNGAAKIEAYANGWYRVSLTVTSAASSTGYFGFGLALNDAVSYAGVASNGALFYGIQLEVGSYPTSYISTYGASLTRVAESNSATGVSALIGQTQGTLFAQVGDFPQEYNGRIFAISDGTADTYITIIKNGSNKNFAVYVDNGGAAQVSYTGSGTLANNSKIAIGYANNDYVIYVNGTQVHTDTSASVPACDKVYIGQRENGTVTFIAGGSLKQNLLFKTRLSNEELAALTTI